MVDPRELTPGYAFADRNRGTAWAVLRDGSKVVWTCKGRPGHRAHPVPLMAGQCAQAELERRLQGAEQVLWTGHCEPCGLFWDLGAIPRIAEGSDAVTALLRGTCPRCTVPYVRSKIAILEREEAKVR